MQCAEGGEARQHACHPVVCNERAPAQVQAGEIFEGPNVLSAVVREVLVAFKVKGPERREVPDCCQAAVGQAVAMVDAIGCPGWQGSVAPSPKVQRVQLCEAREGLHTGVG
eukprot:CAMPEP_0117651304 /NCGR_PEP_ID=MMETSP0804-20121206/2020_1 /TAXON_ID=1074897 /ORGANISM="Tetraselmis astigmatica, Strain CCMP880" /LENGTH=110 /DNA_ID=CAMNT_0005457271 /DNA_START=373 /DNA_END=705 /DNA_ORIENTATION=+